MSTDLKTTAGSATTAPASALVFGADTAAAANPNVYTTTGSGNVVLATSPTLVTPTIGVATATSVNKVALTAPASGSTLTIADGKTLTASNSITLAGTDSTTMTFPGVSSSIGYLYIPQVGGAAKTTSYGAVLADNGMMTVMNATTLTYTIPANASVAFPVGSVLTIVNIFAGNLSIAITTDTLTFAGSTTTGTRTLAQNGVATALKVTSTSWIISGTGLT